MMLYREEYYDEFTENKWITDLFIRKNRNWPIWNVQLFFNKNNQKFHEIERNLIEGGI
jgi:replicative DNA helicase